MLIDILKLLKSPDIEMMNNAATITFNVSVLLINHVLNNAFYETDVVCRGSREPKIDQRTRGPKLFSKYCKSGITQM